MIKLLCILFLSVFSLAMAGRVEVKQNMRETAAVQANFQSKLFQGKLRVVQDTSTLHRGDAGIITLEGQPGVRYRLRSSFRIGNRTVPVTQWRTAGANGLVTFNWVVSHESALGTYPIIITGGGNTIELSHTVIP